MFDDEIWDEERWEEFLSENDRRLARRLSLFFDYLAEHPRPENGPADVVARWEDDFRRTLLGNGFHEDDPLLRMIGEDSAALNGDSLESDPDDDFDNAGEPERPVDELSVHRKAIDLSVEILRWSDSLPVDEKDSTFVHFCANVTQIPANVARGHGFGYEKDMIGGNIACVKRGLEAANEGLLLLRYLKSADYMPSEHYHELYERLFELRNDLGIYVQQLRERFELGID